MADREDEETVAAAEEHGAGAGEEEDTGAQIAPIVRLEEVAVKTGEENEEVLLDMKARLYRYDQVWKERGTGVIKILKDKETNKTRVLMRQNKTLKICANHYLVPGMTLQEHAGSDKSWVWHAMDYSDGEVKKELLCVRFGSVENAQRFKDIYVERTEEQGEKKATEEESKEESKVAETLEKLSVKDLSSDPVKSAANDDEKEKPAVDDVKADGKKE
ncbi:hypothetical protein SELMODRAFT_165523 [Selaginella moellendorffii]|uniref:RanBD1 domain-containing protein n=1 Tax=Selaginella moellendorffii TaxID=88036 RepID=D8QV06_SELML|nr:ran-binding protein 1 homolog b [Selaginella moellendorffii]EFJ35962.1 hypothetical protein SELMODRAFT_165523 [Selaginella moellendorffii]|eukprot:XP_002962499.1 ran-binding protein 1 homolog b [Selaginella moellendorffii]